MRFIDVVGPASREIYQQGFARVREQGSVASVDIWQWTPFVYLVLFAGLQTVPRESIEAAQVDGAIAVSAPCMPS